MILGSDWRVGVEAEAGPRDGQALARRLELKRRDGGVDHLILLLRANRASARFLAEVGPLLRPSFPADEQETILRLRAGLEPSGSAILRLPCRHAAGGV